ncbi:hypothetical protein ACHWQZ_G001619 [Mnemiopsis leidyi]
MGEWKIPLWGCFDDIGACLITYFVPCWTFGKVAESVGEDCLIYGILGIVPIVYGYFRFLVRKKVASKAGIDESDLVALLISYCLPLCGNLQERKQQGVDVMPRF